MKLLVDKYEVIKSLNDKVAMYDYFRNVEGINILDYEMVNTISQFENAYNQLKEKYNEVCVKFVKDESAMSDRRIVNQIDEFNRLKIYPGAEMSYNTYLSFFREVNSFENLIVILYLPENEISMDCLKTDKGLIAIPRYKSYSRHERICFDKDVLDMISIIMKNVNLECPCNVQYKIKDDIPYLLEINTRMAGGLQMSCLAEGINIPHIALNSYSVNLLIGYLRKRKE